MKVVDLHPQQNSNDVLDACKDKMSEVVVMGWGKEEGYLTISASESLSAQDMLWMLEQTKMALINSTREDDD